MPELHAPPGELAEYLSSNVPWDEVAEMYGYDTGRDARNAALAAKRQMDDSAVAPA
jgi:hypothetical protein